MGEGDAGGVGFAWVDDDWLFCGRAVDGGEKSVFYGFVADDDIDDGLWVGAGAKEEESKREVMEGSVKSLHNDSLNTCLAKYKVCWR